MSNEWQYKALKGLSWLTCCLPYSAVLKIGAALGPVYGLIAGKQKKRGIKNAQIGLGISETEASHLMDRLFENLGRSALEIMYMPNLTSTFIRDHIEIRGASYLEDTLSQGKGVVVLTAHVGNWEWMAAALAENGYPTTTIVKKQPNAQFTRLLNEYREAAGVEVFARGGNELIRAARALKQKKLLGFLADQDGYIDGLPVPFLGQDSSAVVGPATFAQKFGSPVLPIFMSRGESADHHIVHVLPPLYYKDTGNTEVDMYRLTEECCQVTETFIKEHPDEWLWFQHRWNTKPHEINDLEHKMRVRELVHEEK